MIQDIKYWIEISKYDLDTAKAMLDARRYLYVLFTCQQAIEKLLKAIVINETKEFPPRLHNLLRLAETAKLNITEEERKFLEKLSYYYIETRYPERREKLAEGLNNKVANDYYVKAKELWEKLKKKLI